MDQFDALAICANPLRERAAYARESIVSQLGREDDLGDATYHRTIERKRLLRRDRFNLRFYFSCPNAKAERGTEAAEPTDKRATGEHPANVRGVGRATRRFAPRNGGEIPHTDSRGGAEKRMRRGDTTVFSAASAPPRDALGSVCYCSMRTSCLLSPVSYLLHRCANSGGALHVALGVATRTSPPAIAFTASARAGRAFDQRARVPRTSMCANGPLGPIARYSPRPPTSAGNCCSTFSTARLITSVSRKLTEPSRFRSSIRPS